MLPIPKSQLTAILYNLIIRNEGVSEKNFNYNGFRSRISELRDHLTIKDTKVSFTNGFNHKNKFKRHWLDETEKKKAVKFYLSLFKK